MDSAWPHKLKRLPDVTTLPRVAIFGAVAALAGAVVLLVALIMWTRLRRRAAIARYKRGGKWASQQSGDGDGAEVIIDDPRGYAARRAPPPWPLSALGLPGLPSQRLWSDSSRGLGAGLGALLAYLAEGATGPYGADLGPDDDDGYSGGQTGGSGPRFVASTASGKSLQVVVNTTTAVAHHTLPPWRLPHGTAGAGKGAAAGPGAGAAGGPVSPVLVTAAAAGGGAVGPGGPVLGPSLIGSGGTLRPGPQEAAALHQSRSMGREAGAGTANGAVALVTLGSGRSADHDPATAFYKAKAHAH
ncbi:hypothetical protein HYH03_010392 [Edaphochlamys debaryana]|uniref:Uncharacterized protein n=1 Tax=Edaphochlamys debaryana TaxID=47281 RepID=A0A835XZA9_9CHLO|nr:hypothetical protein HYH03_010392 [Edaphochlamys debaryana]|eukprot:KAG2491181.1 hypothetical protein HYH03_010392 [Edaphochlamys debaryana]